MPKADSPTIASPLSFRRTRWNRSFATTPPKSAGSPRGLRATPEYLPSLLSRRRVVIDSHFKPSKPPHDDILAQLADSLPDEVPNAQLWVLDKRLLEQDHGRSCPFPVTVFLVKFSPRTLWDFIDRNIGRRRRR